MEINSQLPQTSLYNLFNPQKEQSENIRPNVPAPIKNATSETIKENPTNDSAAQKERETYGLLVLELMSNDEYDAFKRATAGMSEGEKMLAAQSLYSLTNFYNGKYNSSENPKIDPNPYEKNAQKAFGIQTQNLNNFLDRYKNAYGSAESFDIKL